MNAIGASTSLAPVDRHTFHQKKNVLDGFRLESFECVTLGMHTLGWMRKENTRGSRSDAAVSNMATFHRRSSLSLSLSLADRELCSPMKSV